ncbi:pilus assembly protein [Thauera butanivorans]|uniref:pilus assembly protein n=1 Tax=Thauera butanivorans TaxID=86174 RepID=UPI0009FF9DE9|nr:PilC/PilY family type IV pilus protein [Thauera butanivorans]
MITRSKSSFFFSRPLWLAIAVSVVALPAQADLDLATSPLFSSTAAEVNPNLMFIIDNSGSMAYDNMPDVIMDNNYCKGTKASGTNAPWNQTAQTGSRCCHAADSTSAVSSCYPGKNSNNRGMPLFHSSPFNTIYYDPEITYSAPLSYDGTEKTRFDGSSGSTVPLDGYGKITTDKLDLLNEFWDLEYCTSTSYTDCLRNDNYILPGKVAGKTYVYPRHTVASGTATFATGPVDAPTTESRRVGPYYYVIVASEYCTNDTLANCIEADAPSADYPVPAPIRWCTDQNRTDCRAIQGNGYNTIKYPTIITDLGSTAENDSSGVIEVRSGSVLRSTKTGTNAQCDDATEVVTVGAITVNGTNILPSGGFRYCNSSSTANTRRQGLATALAGFISENGFSASSPAGTGSSNIYRVKVVAPDGSYNGATVSFTVSGGSGTVLTLSSAFTGGLVARSMAYLPGRFMRIDIVSGRDYGNITDSNGTVVVDRSGRTDCEAAPVCTYAEELKNFQNWFAWYRTRMQVMKTSVSRAFVSINDNYRVGFYSINSPGTHYLKVNDFSGGASGHKSAWYTKLFNVNASGTTPLRPTLADVGRIFAGKLRDDPMQYSCQQNFALLTTDGYWNESKTTIGENPDIKKIDGTPMSNQDGSGTARPMYEGPSASASSLADVAKYYYDTDLRTPALDNCTGSKGLEVCQNNVFTSASDNNSKQHMTTFTLGLGVNGTLNYQPDYKTAPSGDFHDIRTGLKNWPVPSNNHPTGIDDLWHAAVNGRGTYFSAGDPQQLSDGLAGALQEIQAKTGAGAAAAASTLNPVEGDNYFYVASYVSVKWTGNLEKREIDLNTGAASTIAVACAENVFAVDNSLQCTGTMRSMVSATSDSRNIYMKGSSGSLVSFDYDNMTATQQAYFGTSVVSGLGQWSLLSTEQKANAVDANLVNYLRGQTAYEGSIFRERETVLGDLIESAPFYIAKPYFNYHDKGYAEFKTSLADRAGTVYVGGNDGMLHAFDAADLTERWAYVPSMVMQNMWRLADKNYATRHRYFVNASPVVYDICSANCDIEASAVWRSILISGLNGGGKGYFALDVTDPASPSLMWEFTHNDLGYSFGNPVVTKLENGTWVVIFASGYNNSGEGKLFVLNAATGAVIRIIGTGVGSAGAASGLAKIKAWADDLNHDNTAGYTYGGDLLGNVWRFDINHGASAENPLRLAQLYADDEGTKPQPITTAPELGEIGHVRMVYVATGKYLEFADVNVDNAITQSVYAIKDDDVTSTLDNPRTVLVEQILTESEDGTERSSTAPSAVNLSTDRGWYVDLPTAGELAHVDPQLVRGLLLVPSTVPAVSACEPGGYSWMNAFNYKTGIADNSIRIHSPIVGVNVVEIDGELVVSVVTADNPTPMPVPGFDFLSEDSGRFRARRAFWREYVPQ